MDEGKFDGLALRLNLTPRLSRSEMARKLGVSETYMRQLEKGGVKWPVFRRERFIEIAEQWRGSPWKVPRKVRKDTGKKHRKPKRAPKAEVVLVPVPHSHGEVVGIG